jgi:hypothetical protein
VFETGDRRRDEARNRRRCFLDRARLAFGVERVFSRPFLFFPAPRRRGGKLGGVDFQVHAHRVFLRLGFERVPLLVL